MAIQEIDSSPLGDDPTITSFISVLAFQRAVTLTIRMSNALMASGIHMSLNKNKIPTLQLS